jgi:thiamine kinase-like enzyme
MSYPLKQPYVNSHDSSKLIRREAAIYALALDNSEFKPISEIMPRILKFDALDLLITELIKNGKSLNQYIYGISTTEFPNSLAVILGKVIATYHGTFVRHKDNPGLSFLPREFPSIFYLCHPGPEVFNRLSLANLKLIKLIQKQQELSNLFEDLQNNWRIHTIIHGDIRWDNIIIVFSDDNNESLQVKLIDWEFAILGDPAWDIGCVFHDFIVFWLYSLRAKGNETIEQLLTYAQYPLQYIQSIMRIFWHTYTSALQINQRESDELLYRSTKYRAIRILQTVYESSFEETDLSNISLTMVQLSINILNDIGSAITYLLGIPLRGYYTSSS